MSHNEDHEHDVEADVVFIDGVGSRLTCPSSPTFASSNSPLRSNSHVRVECAPSVIAWLSLSIDFFSGDQSEKLILIIAHCHSSLSSSTIMVAASSLPSLSHGPGPVVTATSGPPVISGSLQVEGVLRS